MKSIMVLLLIAAIAGSCSEGKKEDTSTATSDTAGIATSKPTADSVSIKELLSGYFSLKNALANDNGAQASKAGIAITSQLQKLNEGSMATDQKKVYEEVRGSLLDHTKNIADNAGKIEHQREHFDLLSADMYDLVKVFPVEQTLYVDHCPMYNDKKGANWLSEVKEIRNPYYGKEMLECGTVKEEIKASK